MSKVLIIGATRGLGHSLVTKYASTSSNTVYGTTRSANVPKTDAKIHWVPHIDLTNEGVGTRLVNQLGGLGVGGSMSGGVQAFDVVVGSALVIWRGNDTQ